MIVTSLASLGGFFRFKSRSRVLANVTRVGQTDAWKAKYANEVLLVGWGVGWLGGWLVGWLDGWLVCWLVVGFLYVVAVVSVPFAWQFFPKISWSSCWIWRVQRLQRFPVTKTTVTPSNVALSSSNETPLPFSKPAKQPPVRSQRDCSLKDTNLWSLVSNVLGSLGLRSANSPLPYA